MTANVRRELGLEVTHQSTFARATIYRIGDDTTLEHARVRSDLAAFPSQSRHTGKMIWC
jgi:hypothetical protein